MLNEVSNFISFENLKFNILLLWINYSKSKLLGCIWMVLYQAHPLTQKSFGFLAWREHKPILPCAKVQLLLARIGGGNDQTLDHLVIETLILSHELTLSKAWVVRWRPVNLTSSSGRLSIKYSFPVTRNQRGCAW